MQAILTGIEPQSFGQLGAALEALEPQTEQRTALPQLNQVVEERRRLAKNVKRCHEGWTAARAAWLASLGTLDQARGAGQVSARLSQAHLTAALERSLAEPRRMLDHLDRFHRVLTELAMDPRDTMYATMRSSLAGNVRAARDSFAAAPLEGLLINDNYFCLSDVDYFCRSG